MWTHLWPSNYQLMPVNPYISKIIYFIYCHIHLLHIKYHNMNSSLLWFISSCGLSCALIANIKVDLCYLVFSLQVYTIKTISIPKNISVIPAHKFQHQENRLYIKHIPAPSRNSLIKEPWIWWISLRTFL